MPEENRPLAAAGVIFAALSFIAFTDSFFPRIAGVIGLWQFHLLRALIALPILMIFARFSGVAIVPTRKWPVFLRGMLISGSMIFYFGALGFMTVPQAAAGLFTSPLWVLLLTAVVLRQRIGPRRLGAVIVGFGGVLMVLNPGSSGFSWALAMPIIGGMFYALAAIATRRWCAGETALSLLAAFFVCMILWGAGGIGVLHFAGIQAPTGPDGLLLRAWGTLDGDTIFWIILQSVTAIFGIYGLTRGYQLAEASYAAVFEYSFIVFAAIWGVILFASWPTFWQVNGMALIILSGLLIASSPAARNSGV